MSQRSCGASGRRRRSRTCSTRRPMPYLWAEGADRYSETGTGPFVPVAQGRGAVDVVIQQTAVRLQQITGGLQSGVLAIEDWRGLMAAEIKSVHLATASAAMG